MKTKTTLTILLILSALLSLALQPKPLLAFSSPIPRPTLDPAWVCQQLENCPSRAHKHTRQHNQNYITLPYYSTTPEPNQLIRLP